MSDSPAAKTGRVAAGTWGGEHIRVQVREGGADIEYDCARGTIDAPLELDDAGRFDATGTHVPQRPGPVRLGVEPQSRPARYVGGVRGQTMTLAVSLSDTSEDLGTFKLTRGSAGRVWKCR